MIFLCVLILASCARAEVLPKSQRNSALGSLRQVGQLTSAFIASNVMNARASGVFVGSLDRNDFRERYPYTKPSDFITYLDDVAEEGNFDSVVGAAYAFADVYPMYGLSREKAMFLGNLVKNRRSSSILEIGTFFGFSTCFMLQSMPNDCTLTCIEGNEENIEVAKAVVEKAFGRGAKVLDRWKVIPGLSSDILRKVSGVEVLTGSPTRLLDFVFLDHDKSYLLPDTRILESREFLADKAALVADNVIFPGAPDFLEYVKAPDKRNIGVAESAEQGAPWETKLYPFPFERVGYETGFKVKEDAMSVSFRTRV